MRLILGNKNYSSWSMRAWMVAKLAGLTFNESLIDLKDKDAKVKIKDLSGAARVPILVVDEVVVWDSLAISEYCAEKKPSILPRDEMARARARSLIAEVHSSFAALRTEMPMNLRATNRRIQASDAAIADILRVDHVWSIAQAIYQRRYLFDDQPCVADCFYAPIVSRLVTYDVQHDKRVQLTNASIDYMETIQQWPLYQAWVADAQQESSVIEALEVGRPAVDA